jgi:hypothetical protein
MKGEADGANEEAEVGREDQDPATGDCHNSIYSLFALGFHGTQCLYPGCEPFGSSLLVSLLVGIFPYACVLDRDAPCF